MAVMGKAQAPARFALEPDDATSQTCDADRLFTRTNRDPCERPWSRVRGSRRGASQFGKWRSDRIEGPWVSREGRIRPRSSSRLRGSCSAN